VYLITSKRTKIEIRKRAREVVAKHLSSHPCVDCGESDPVLLEFDHVVDEKICNISVILGARKSINGLLAEIAKCAIRCVNCHRRKTAKTFNTWRWKAAQQIKFAESRDTR